MSQKVFSQNKYSQLLFVLVAFYLLAPFIENITPEFPVISAMFLASILLTLRVVEIPARNIWLSMIFGIGAVAVESAIGRGTSLEFRSFVAFFSSSIYAAFLTFVIILMIKKMFNRTEVNGDTIVGGIAVYLLIGFLWTLFYYMIYHFDHSAFVVPENWDDIYLFYFSIVTLTTLGYGDVHPINKLAMSLASLEAVVGQMYVAIFVARLVGLHITKDLKKK